MRKVAITCILIIIVIIVILLCYFGVIWPNSFFASRYSIHGLDVSNYQKEINWSQVVEDKKIKFVFIKATEGKDYKDKYFEANWNAASKAGIFKGAYHYFTTKSSGKEQARNFIEQVPVEKGVLPPVIDIEEDGISKEDFKKQLSDYISMIVGTYHQTPILYVTYSMYNEYIKDGYEQCYIWVRDIIMPPNLSDKRRWLVWQYCNRGRVEGINTYVDLNVFDGDIERLKSLLTK